MCAARQTGILFFLHLDSLFFFPSSSSSSSLEASERGERVPMSQYLDRRSRRPVPTLRSDRQPGLTSTLGARVSLLVSPHQKIDRDILS